MATLNTRRSRNALVAFVPAMICLASPSARAATITFDGQLPSGSDPLGGTYSAGPTGGGLVQFDETAGIQADPTKQVLFNPVGSGLADATSFTLKITGSLNGILPLDRGFGNFFETFKQDSSILSSWTATENAAGTEITYTAGSGNALLPGQRFDTVTTFSMFNNLPTDFAYSITWTGDAVTSVPEPTIWAMFIGGFGLIGVRMRRRKVAVSFAEA